MSTNFKPNAPSEGEQFVADFFESVAIKYEAEKRIEGLKFDSKQYRTADFYLPKYKVYVEFFGLWNNADNEAYRHKKEVYRANNIPCVYLYPENLGIIGYSFDKRIQLVLEKHGMEKELRKYKIYKLRETRELRNRGGILSVCIFLICYGIFSIGFASLDWAYIALIAAIGLYQAEALYHLYMDIFKRNKFPLDHLW